MTSEAAANPTAESWLFRAFIACPELTGPTWITFSPIASSTSRQRPSSASEPPNMTVSWPGGGAATPPRAGGGDGGRAGGPRLFRQLRRRRWFGGSHVDDQRPWFEALEQ